MTHESSHYLLAYISKSKKYLAIVLSLKSLNELQKQRQQRQQQRKLQKKSKETVVGDPERRIWVFHDTLCQ